jgi:PHP family Zn ribbon phosphoesterase
MYIITDLQLHSKFSRAVSKDMTIPGIYEWAKRKGIHLVATGDWTHPLWMKEIQENLEEMGTGLLRIKNQSSVFGSQFSDTSSSVVRVPVADKLKTDKQKSENRQQKTDNRDPLFLLATEVSCIYTQGGKGRRIHTLIWVPTIDSALKINKEMAKRGCNLMSDGRPIIGLTSIEVAELVFSIESKALVIPAHAWTPWFGAYGSMSGFDSLAEEFGPYADRIYAVETGLSSNPSMNWQIKELDHRSIVSFSDAHSGPKLGREASVFSIPDGKLSYQAVYEAITEPGRLGKLGGLGDVKNNNCRIAYTIEFYPEEGKYHYTGHRTCNIRWGPEETKEKGTTCPVCGKPLTQGVVQRVEELAGRTETELQLASKCQSVNASGVELNMMYSKAFPNRPPFVMLVPLQEIIAECIGSPVTSNKTQAIYMKLTDHFQGEFAVLLSATQDEIEKIAGERIAVGITKVRSGDIIIDPGYDGVFGVVKLWKEGEEKPLIDASKEQLSLF